ncbi:MAG: protein kinase [Proteobacteria bacterium]|nr:protein kinase [Pseudomonadota bacterium]
MARILPDVLTEADFPAEFGRYTLLGILGEGGMARVFKAEMQGPEGFKKRAAVKIVRSALAADNERLRTSLINEARLGGLLHHPNIVDTYDFGDVDGLPFIAMEYVRGIGLEQVLHAVQPLPAEVAFEIAVQMCAGLDHAHNIEDVEGVTELVHRDLKPSNVLLSRDGLVKVMDFGIAKAAAVSVTNTATGMTKGTPSYMSPEQVNGEALDRRSDLFAVGAILYELFTGKRLFMADSLMSILMAVMQVEERLDASGALDELDMIALGLTDVVRKCLRRNAADRWDDAADLEHQLKLLARTLDPPPPLKKWTRELMSTHGLGNVGESSINTAPPRVAGGVAPQTLAPPPAAAAAAAAPVTQVPPTRQQVPTQPSAPAAAAAAPEPVPPTRVQVPPPAPPTTDPVQTAGAPPAGTLWMGDEPPKKGSPVLLILLGLLLGGGLALIGAIGAFVLLGGDDGGDVYVSNDLPEDLPPLGADLEGDAVADLGAEAEPATASRRPAPTVRETRERVKPPKETAPPQPTLEPTARETLAERTRETTRTGSSSSSEPNTPSQPTLTGVNGELRGRDGKDVKARFVANLNGPCEDPQVNLHFNPPGARWVKRSMQDVGGRWMVDIPFAPKNQGKVYWYVKAHCAGSKPITHGSEGKPRKLKVE